MESRDDASTYVLEAMLIAFILVGSAYAVTTLNRSSMDNVRPREGLERLSSDVLVVLEGLGDARGGTVLEHSILEAMHCARDRVPSTHDCDGNRPANLTLKFEGYLPRGAQYSLKLGNGAKSRVIYETGAPSGEASASSIAYTPQWNTTFILPELSCYPASSAANVSMLPLHRGRKGELSALNVSYGASPQVVAVRAGDGWSGWWNATIPGGTRSVTSILAVNATGRGAPYNGSTSLGTCDLLGAESVIVPALRSSSFWPDASSVPLGSNVTLRATLSPLSGLSGVGVGTSEITIYEPITPRLANDTWLLAARLPLPAGETPSVTWTPSADAVYGSHVAVLRVNLTVGSQPVVAQRAAIVDIALPTGQVPVDPIYRAHLLAWMPDWG